jgi:flagellar hook-associated protein 2
MSSSTSGLAVTGIGSSLPIDSIVSKLMAVESLPLQQMQQQQQSYQSKISAYGQVQGALSSFQAQVVALESPTNFNVVSTNSSNTSVASVSASGNSVQDSSYSINVTQLAQGQRLVSKTGYSSTSSVIGGGTLTFTFGTTGNNTFTSNASVAPSTVTIPANASLQDIANAVNGANIGVQASIINDGINGNRLVYTSTNTGAAYSLKVTADNPNGPLANFTNDPAGSTMTQLQAAQDAQFTLNGVSIDKSSNTVSDAINGLSFSLSATGSATLTVSHNNSGAQQAIQGFVSSYNSLRSTLNQVSAYDTSPVAAGQAHQAAALNGDASILALKNQLRSVFNQIPPGLENSPYRVPADVGLTFDRSGNLTLDNSKLQKALTANPQAVAQLFGALGVPSDSQVSYQGSTANTKVGTYAVNITGMQHAVLLGSKVASGNFPMSSGNLSAFDVTVDGVALTNVSWPAGQTYNSAADAAVGLQSAINTALAADPNGSGLSVAASVDAASGGIVLQSNSSGTKSSLTVSGLSALGFTDGSTNTGQANVSGTIGGFAALGNGNTLVGSTGTPVAGLSININGGPAGSRGTVSFTRGFANAMDDLLTQLQSSKGLIQSAISGLNSSVTAIGKQIDAENQRLTKVQQGYLTQFNAMDGTVSKLNSLGSWLAQQFGGSSSSKTA